MRQPDELLALLASRTYDLDRLIEVCDALNQREHAQVLREWRRALEAAAEQKR